MKPMMRIMMEKKMKKYQKRNQGGVVMKVFIQMKNHQVMS